MLLTKLRQPEQRLTYTHGVIDYGWSRNMLNIHIKTKLLERADNAVTNFYECLPVALNSTTAHPVWATVSIVWNSSYETHVRAMSFSPCAKQRENVIPEQQLKIPTPPKMSARSAWKSQRICLILRFSNPPQEAQMAARIITPETDPHLFIPGTSYLKPIIDVIFKILMTRNPDALKSLLNAVLRPKIPVESVRVLNPNIQPRSLTAKSVRLDVHAKLQDEAEVDIEMQTSSDNHFARRAIYYTSRLLGAPQGECFLTHRKSVTLDLGPVLGWKL